jgi:hypothetical protein
MPDTADLRIITRRVKKLALAKAEEVLSNPLDPLYKETYLITLKNCIPQTREITGEDGGVINVNLTKYGDTNSVDVSAPSIPIINLESV